MALVVESVGATNWVLGATSNFTATFTKLTGLAVGDLMIGCFFTDAGTVPITTLTSSVWTANGPGDASAETSRLFMLHKVADSGDVAASNFTFTTNYSGSGGGKVGGAILRVSGFASSTSPVIATDVDNNRSATGASFTSFNGTFTPAQVNSLLVFMIAGTNNETGSGTFSGYTVSGTNPTWTERFDIFDADADDAIFAVATAIDSTTTNRTTASATCSVSQDDYLLLLASFQEAVNVTCDVSFLSVTPSIEGVTASVNVGVDVSHIANAPTLQGIETRATQNPWTNPDKPTTTWTNPEK